MIAVRAAGINRGELRLLATRDGPVLGRRVLVTGAAGGVGRFAVELAAHGGAAGPSSLVTRPTSRLRLRTCGEPAPAGPGVRRLYERPGSGRRLSVGSPWSWNDTPAALAALRDRNVNGKAILTID